MWQWRFFASDSSSCWVIKKLWCKYVRKIISCFTLIWMLRCFFSHSYKRGFFCVMKELETEIAQQTARRRTRKFQRWGDAARHCLFLFFVRCLWRAALCAVNSPETFFCSQKMKPDRVRPATYTWSHQKHREQYVYTIQWVGSFFCVLGQNKIKMSSAALHPHASCLNV